MFVPTLLGALLGLAAGVAASSIGDLRLGAAFWGPVLMVVGGTQGWIGWWILRQSGDVPKMKAAVPLTGPVLVSVACVFTGVGFTLPVVGTLLVGLLLGLRLSRVAGSA